MYCNIASVQEVPIPTGDFPWPYMAILNLREGTPYHGGSWVIFPKLEDPAEQHISLHFSIYGVKKKGKQKYIYNDAVQTSSKIAKVCHCWITYTYYSILFLRNEKKQNLIYHSSMV